MSQHQELTPTLTTYDTTQPCAQLTAYILIGSYISTNLHIAILLIWIHVFTT